MHVTQFNKGVRVASEQEQVAMSRLLALAVIHDPTCDVTSAHVDRQLSVALAMMSGRNCEEDAADVLAAAAEAVAEAVPVAAGASVAEAEPETAARASEAALRVMGSVPFEPRGARTAAPKAVRANQGS